MRFLNTTTLEFEEVADSEIHLHKNKYAILSHRWGSDEDEVTYDQMASTPIHKKGYSKIKEFCGVVSDRCRYAWVDTCCINKRNSAELAEAINSMYLWYKLSSICVVYLEDVPCKRLEDSEWFDRGWTLQELVAPRKVSFYDCNWNFLGKKIDLLETISRKTSIPSLILSNKALPSTCSVAQRMSWASRRITKRVEDRAYSLLGLFNVSMPMIYGEREKAFLRLQQQIAQQDKDESLFAWSMSFRSTHIEYCGVYASSPSAFEASSNFVRMRDSEGFTERNGEMSIRLALVCRSPGIYKAFLRCTDITSPDSMVFIVIAKVHEEGAWVRVKDPSGISLGSDEHQTSMEKQNIRFLINPREPPTTVMYGFWLRTLRPPGFDECKTRILSAGIKPKPDYVTQYDEQSASGLVHFRPHNTACPSRRSQIRWMKFGYDKDFNPIIWLANDDESERLLGALESDRTQQEGLSRNMGLQGDIPGSIEVGKDTPYKITQRLQHNWPGGRALVRVTKATYPWFDGASESKVYETKVLGMSISIKLQRFDGPVNIQLPLAPTWVWTVDVMEISELPERPSSDRSTFESPPCISLFCPCTLFWSGYKRTQTGHKGIEHFLPVLIMSEHSI